MRHAEWVGSARLSERRISIPVNVFSSEVYFRKKGCVYQGDPGSSDTRLESCVGEF